MHELEKIFIGRLLQSIQMFIVLPQDLPLLCLEIWIPSVIKISNQEQKNMEGLKYLFPLFTIQFKTDRHYGGKFLLKMERFPD